MTERDGNSASGDAARAAGQLASGVCRELVRPLRVLREDLAVMVELLDRHCNAAKGPSGLPWRELDSLRHDLADCYLRCRETARLATELDGAIGIGADGHGTSARGAEDLNKLVESALHLSRHRISEETEVFVDLGTVPTVRVRRSPLLLALASSICLAADSAAVKDGSALSIKTRRIDSDVVVSVLDNGSGCPKRIADVRMLAQEVAESCGGTAEATSEDGRGSAFELRLPVSA